MPRTSGTVIPNNAIGAGGREMAAALAEVRAIASELRAATVEHRHAVSHLRSMPPDQVVSMARPETVARQVATDFERRGAASERIRTLERKR